MPLYTVSMTGSPRAREWIFARVQRLRSIPYPRPPDVILALNLATEGAAVVLPGDGVTEVKEEDLLALRELGLTVEVVACQVCGGLATQTEIDVADDSEHGLCDAHADAIS